MLICCWYEPRTCIPNITQCHHHGITWLVEAEGRDYFFDVTVVYEDPCPLDLCARENQSLYLILRFSTVIVSGICFSSCPKIHLKRIKAGPRQCHCRIYVFGAECKGAIFTWQGCIIEMNLFFPFQRAHVVINCYFHVTDHPSTDYVSEETPMNAYGNLHVAFEQMRVRALGALNGSPFFRIQSRMSTPCPHTGIQKLRQDECVQDPDQLCGLCRPRMDPASREPRSGRGGLVCARCTVSCACEQPPTNVVSRKYSRYGCSFGANVFVLEHVVAACVLVWASGS